MLRFLYNLGWNHPYGDIIVAICADPWANSEDRAPLAGRSPSLLQTNSFRFDRALLVRWTADIAKVYLDNTDCCNHCAPMNGLVFSHLKVEYPKSSMDRLLSNRCRYHPLKPPTPSRERVSKNNRNMIRARLLYYYVNQQNNTHDLSSQCISRAAKCNPCHIDSVAVQPFGKRLCIWGGRTFCDMIAHTHFWPAVQIHVSVLWQWWG